MRLIRTILLGCLALGLAVATTHSALAAQYDTGATDKEIKIGHIGPYSGPASSYAAIGRGIIAYFKMVNDEGGINGRKITILSYDDGYSPPKTVEQARRLVEQDEVLFIFQSLGTPTNLAIQKYLNAKKIPQLFVATGASRWGDHEHFPWTMGWQPDYRTEGKIYGRYIAQNQPSAKVAVLYQNDDYGKDYLNGLKDGLGAKANQIVAEQTYEVTDPTIDSQLATLKNSGADVFMDVTAPKQAAQAIRKLPEIGWHPTHFLNSISVSIAAVLQPAGLENSKGLISVAYGKDRLDPQWKDDAGIKHWEAFMAKYMPGSNLNDANYPYAYSVSQTLVQVLKQCGDDLTRANVMRQAANIHNLELELLLPGIKINTSPTDYYPIQQEQLNRFNGERWVPFGPVISAE